MNAINTAALSTGQNLSQDSFQHFDQAAAYTGDMLITFTDDCVLMQELDDIVLDMGTEEQQ